MEGVILNDLILELKEKEVSDLYKSLDKVISKFHQATMNWEVPKDFKRHSFDVDGFVGSEPFWEGFGKQRMPLMKNEKVIFDKKEYRK